MLDKARRFAQAAHGEQKYGIHPYVVHLDAVAEIAKPYGETAQVVSYLHDVIEDTDVDDQTVRSEFGDFVAECVGILTDEPGDNRKERKAKTYAKMSQVSGKLELALLVKAADRLANFTASSEQKNSRLMGIYRNEQPAFRQAAYRPGLCDDIWQKIEALAVD